MISAVFRAYWFGKFLQRVKSQKLLLLGGCFICCLLEPIKQATEHEQYDIDTTMRFD